MFKILVIAGDRWRDFLNDHFPFAQSLIAQAAIISRRSRFPLSVQECSDQESVSWAAQRFPARQISDTASHGLNLLLPLSLSFDVSFNGWGCGQFR